MTGFLSEDNHAGPTVSRVGCERRSSMPNSTLRQVTLSIMGDARHLRASWDIREMCTQMPSNLVAFCINVSMLECYYWLFFGNSV